jgi:PAS domain S-box-containing protein
MGKINVFLKEKIYPYIKFDFFENKFLLFMIFTIILVLTGMSFFVMSRYIAIPGLLIVIISSIIFASKGAIYSVIWLSILFFNTIIFVPEQTLELSFKNPFILNYIVIYLTAALIAKNIDYIYSQKQKLAKSKKMYNSVVQTQNDMICRFKKDTTLTFVNDAYCSKFNKNKSELLGEKFINLIPEDDHDAIYEKLDMLSKDNPTQTYSHKVIYDDDNISYQEWTDYAIFDDKGELFEIQSVGRDITSEKITQKNLEDAKREAEKAKNRYQGLVESQNDLIVRVDRDNKFTYVNDAYCRTFGKSREELLGSSFQPLIHPEDREKTLKAMEGLNSPPYRIYVEQRAKTVDGWRWIAWEDNAIQNNKGEIIEVQGVGRDITELKNAQKNAEKANKMKSLFLANISHEIRTPLNVIIGFTEIMEEEELDKKQKKYLESIKIAGNSLLSLINDILDISKIESDAYVINNEFLDINVLTVEIKALFKETLMQKNIDFKIEIKDIDFLIYFDMDILRRILINLINNAIKFTDKGYIRLEINAENIDRSQNKRDINILVEDTGTGIAEDMQEKIFEPFTQLENHKNQTGTGLGLTITKKLVEELDGQINLKSEENKGSKFYLFFPARKIREDKIVSTNKFSDEKIKDLKVLVVDDEELNRELLRLKLEKRGIIVVEADNGKTAYQEFCKESPDIILMDLKMPDEDGYSALKRIKRHNNKLDSKIIALSAAATFEEKTKATEAGFDDFVAKPITKAKLNEIFEKHILDN